MAHMNIPAQRFNGKLSKWNADRGFGFVVAEHGGQELFVHVSAFPRDGRAPVIGEPVSFELGLDKEGRKRAVSVRRPGAPEPQAARFQHHEHTYRVPRRAYARTGSNAFGSRFVVLVLVACAGWYGFTRYSEQSRVLELAPQRVINSAQTDIPEISHPSFECDGRKYCSEMSSCSEAKRFLQNCPGMEMDGDGDGIPCEQQLCTGLFGG